MKTSILCSLVVLMIHTGTGRAEENRPETAKEKLSQQIETLQKTGTIEGAGTLASALIELGSESDDLRGWSEGKGLRVVTKCISTMLDEIRNKTVDRESILVFAEFLGKLRALRLPNYHYVPESPNAIGMRALARSKTPGVNPDMILEPELRKEVEQEWKEWRKKQLVFALQSFLAREDATATGSLLKTAHTYAQSHPNDLTFLQEAAQLARLTKEEQAQLETAAKPKK